MEKNIHQKEIQDYLTRSLDISSQQSVADLCPCDYDPTNFKVSKQFSFELRKKGLSESVQVCRFLLSKIVLKRNLKSLNPYEMAILLGSWERIIKSKDISFQNTNIKLFSSFEYLIEMIGNTQVFDGPHQNQWWLYLFKGLGFNSLCPIFGWWKNFKLSDWLRSINRDLRKKARPKRFIGVGYRDSGTARDVARDASPKWQEVCGLIKEKNLPVEDYRLGFPPWYLRRLRYGF